jgi:hypothetical protein
LERGGKKPVGFIHIADSPTTEDARRKRRHTELVGKTSADGVVRGWDHPFVAGKRLLIS